MEAQEEFQEIPNLKVKPNEIEDMSIFQEAIVGSQNNTITQLITKLQNSDWVKKGLDYLPEDIEETVDCPFCQEKTITKELADNIKRYFDRSYEEKINKLKRLKGSYQIIIDSVQKFEMEHKENNFIKEKGNKFQLLVSQLQTALQNNLQNIENKVQNPSQEIRLKNSLKEIKELYEYIENINKNIQGHNERIKNAQIEKNKIKDKFWQIMRHEYNQIIEFYKREGLSFKKEQKQLKQKQINIHEQIKKQRGVIETNQKNTVNLEIAILNINKNLKNIGITDFHIQKKSDEESYFLSRNSSDSSDFKTLSEGEKTVISFLYFLELCQGKMSKTETSNKKVIVIDDPISSLSHIYVFNIAQFIKHKFFNKTDKYQMIFILTHNLYFFRELAQYTENRKNDTNNEKIKFFRIIKKLSSQISEMKREDIKNDYESYWDILKDYKKSKETHPILPNVMRNILEYFFGFIGKDKLADALNNIDNQKYGAFVRYMNRESHFDRENITDINEIDHSLFFDAFQEVFKQIGHEAHLKKYLK